MTRARGTPVNVPAAVAREEDANRHLARMKASLARRWSLTRMRELFDAVHLAWCFVALGRTDEAREVVGALAAVPFAGDYNIWTPVGHAICLQARLEREAGDVAGWERDMARLRAHPVNVTTNPAATRKLLDSLPAQLEAGLRARSLPSAVEQITTALMELNYYHECGLAGIDYGLPYDVQALEPLLESGLDLLRQHLEAP